MRGLPDKRFWCGRCFDSLLPFWPVVILFIGALDRLWVTEDAFITFRCVENLWAGNGPVFNAGLRVEAYTHPLWFLLLCCLRVFGAPNLPIIAAIVGIMLSCTGLALSIAALRHAQSVDCSKDKILLPVGALSIAVLPPFWDFSSSGLEGGLTFFWIGSSAWLFVRCLGGAGSEWFAAFCIGLGVLIRPDLGLPAAVLFFALASSQGESPLRLPKEGAVRPLTHAIRGICKIPSISCERLRRALALLGAAAAVPVAYQIWRMGYFAAIVPNTAIAKEASAANWRQGWIYLLDTVNCYYLWIPIVLSLILLRGGGEPISGTSVKVRRVFTMAGLLHIAAIVRIGGDFMHARMLLPGLFFVAASLAVVPVRLNLRYVQAATCLLFVWQLAALLFLSPAYRAQINEHGIADERKWYQHTAGVQRPVNLGDYRLHHYYLVGREVQRIMKEQRLAAVYWAHIGIAPSHIGPDKLVIDPLGLNDHISSRIIIRERGRPGHEKIAHGAWFQARFPPGVGMVVKQQLNGALLVPTAEELVLAGAVLRSSPLKELEQAVSKPLTLQRFFKNIGLAYRLTNLRIPQDPLEAAKIYAPDALDRLSRERGRVS